MGGPPKSTRQARHRRYRGRYLAYCPSIQASRGKGLNSARTLNDAGLVRSTERLGFCADLNIYTRRDRWSLHLLTGPDPRHSETLEKNQPLKMSLPDIREAVRSRSIPVIRRKSCRTLLWSPSSHRSAAFNTCVERCHRWEWTENQRTLSFMSRWTMFPGSPPPMILQLGHGSSADGRIGSFDSYTPLRPFTSFAKARVTRQALDADQSIAWMRNP